MQYKIFCIIPNGEDAFSVNIDETETVDDLKKRIMIATVDAAALTLWRVNIDASNMQSAIINASNIQNAINASNMQGFELSEKPVLLNPVAQLSGVVEQFNPDDPKIHILVQLPRRVFVPSLYLTCATPTSGSVSSLSASEMDVDILSAGESSR